MRVVFTSFWSNKWNCFKEWVELKEMGVYIKWEWLCHQSLRCFQFDGGATGLNRHEWIFEFLPLKDHRKNILRLELSMRCGSHGFNGENFCDEIDEISGRQSKPFKSSPTFQRKRTSNERILFVRFGHLSSSNQRWSLKPINFHCYPVGSPLLSDEMLAIHLEAKSNSIQRACAMYIMSGDEIIRFSHC